MQHDEHHEIGIDDTATRATQQILPAQELGSNRRTNHLEDSNAFIVYSLLLHIKSRSL
jgi:hypothetical protein